MEIVRGGDQNFTQTHTHTQAHFISLVFCENAETRLKRIQPRRVSNPGPAEQTKTRAVDVIRGIVNQMKTIFEIRLLDLTIMSQNYRKACVNGQTYRESNSAFALMTGGNHEQSQSSWSTPVFEHFSISAQNYTRNISYYTGWKGNKCHPFNCRRGRFKGLKYI